MHVSFGQLLHCHGFPLLSEFLFHNLLLADIPLWMERMNKAIQKTRRKIFISLIGFTLFKRRKKFSNCENSLCGSIYSMRDYPKLETVLHLWHSVGLWAHHTFCMGNYANSLKMFGWCQKVSDLNWIRSVKMNREFQCGSSDILWANRALGSRFILSFLHPESSFIRF